MERKHLSQILQDAQINLWKEFQRLLHLFYDDCPDDDLECIYNDCIQEFCNMPFKKRYLNIEDFNDEMNFHFRKISQKDFTINDLILFCEYSYTFACHICSDNFYIPTPKRYLLFKNQLNQVIDLIGYYFCPMKNGTYMLVPKDQVANSVAEIINDDDLSYRVIEYNHHSMKGKIEEKKSILFRLANKLEPKRDQLKFINKKLEDNLFFLFNNIDIRHNNKSHESKNYNPLLSFMSNDDLEALYDDTYQLCLHAFLELDNIERIRRIEDLRKR